MLSRTADNLYWMARYMERAEDTARILDVCHRMSQLPDDGVSGNGTDTAVWQPALLIADRGEAFRERGEPITPASVISYMALDGENPSSIRSSIRFAREAGRAERNSISSEMFESLNHTWLELREMTYATVIDMGYRAFFDWVKMRAQLFRGTTVATLLHDERICFHQMGGAIERAETTARLLDVKYSVLAPEEEQVDEAVDYYQWGALLRSLSALKAYRAVFRDSIRPRKVAELLILNPNFPRSLVHCYGILLRDLEKLGPGRESHRLAGETYSRLRYGRLQDITRRGLRRFLAEFLSRNALVSDTIARDFMMLPAVNEGVPEVPVASQKQSQAQSGPVRAVG